MANFKVFFTVEGPGGIMEVPNREPILEMANLASLLSKLSQNLPNNKSFGLEVVGIRVIEEGKDGK